MKAKQLIKILQKVPPDTKIIGYDLDDRGFTDKIQVQEFEHDGLDADCWHLEHSKSVSRVPAGKYILIDIGE